MKIQLKFRKVWLFTQTWNFHVSLSRFKQVLVNGGVRLFLKHRQNCRLNVFKQNNWQNLCLKRFFLHQKEFLFCFRICKRTSCKILKMMPLDNAYRVFYYWLKKDENGALKITQHCHWLTPLGNNMVFVNFASILKQSHGCLQFHEWMCIMKLMRPVNWQSEE